MRPLTVRNRRQNIMMAATALAHSGFPISQITSLRVLVQSQNATDALRFLYKRAGGQRTGHIYQIANMLKTVARHYVVGLDPEAIELLRTRCSALKPQTTGLTEKNKRFLRQFADVEKLASLVTVPQRIIEAAERGPNRRRDAVRVELAVAVGIELSFPLRIDNLAGLSLDRHIQFVGDVVYIGIPADETKNGNALEAELPPRRARQLRIYRDKVRPILIDRSSPWLFPGEGGERRHSGFGAQISAFVAKVTGLTMTVHQFRHLAAKLYLNRHPEDVETVRRPLGHKDRKTTERFYSELESITATKRYGELLDQLLAETEAKSCIPPHDPRPRRK